MNWFNPGNPRYHRGTVIASIYVSALLAPQMVMGDYGTQEHVLSPMQNYVTKKLDHYFDVKPYELDLNYEPSADDGPKEKPFISMRRVDVKSPDSDKK